MRAPRPIVGGLFEADSETVRLRAARCTACEKLHFPETPTCPYCGNERTTPTLVGPSGRLRLFTIVANRPPGYRGPLPYGFGVVELDGTGLEVIARVEETDLARLRPGLPVRLVVEPLFTDDDGTPVLAYAFRPAAPA
jgi:uncharacterized OB-fold protein